MIELALTDLDDTLIPFGANHVSSGSRAAIHELLDAGLRFGPVTGRLPVDMEWMFDDDAACYATGLFANGQIICVDGVVVNTVAIDRALLEAAQLVLDATDGRGYLTLYHPWVLGEIAYVTAHPNRLRRNPPPTFGSITKILPRVTDFPPSVEDSGAPAYVKANVQCCCSREEMVALRDLLRSEVTGLDFVFPSATAPVIDVLPAGWDKGRGVSALVDALGLAPSEVVVFGDFENDLAMIRTVEHSVAVANASEEVRRAAAWHIGACADGAVDDALRELARASRESRMPDFMGG